MKKVIYRGDLRDSLTPPLETLKMKSYCEMCGSKKHLEPAFNPSWIPATLCRECRIGSAELLYERRRKQ